MGHRSNSICIFNVTIAPLMKRPARGIERVATQVTTPALERIEDESRLFRIADWFAIARRKHPMNWTHELFEAVVPLFVTIDAPGLLPVFLGLTASLNAVERRRVSFEAVSAASVIAIAFMFLGNSLFHFLSIEQSDFQIAGGVVLLVLAVIDLLSQGKPTVTEPYLVGLVPLATPLIAGPAMLTTTLVLVGSKGYAITVVALAINFGFLLVVMLLSNVVLRIIGVKALAAFSKLVMVLLAAIAVNFIRVGITQVILSFNLPR